VLEVGLGGRLDATTVHPDRSVLGIAAIGLDHREHLGDTLAAIAGEKAGAMPQGGVAISAPQPDEVAAVLEAEARRRGCRLRWVTPLPDPAAGGPVLGLAGRWQRANAAVAAGMVAEMGLAIPERAVAAGLAAARWPGRLQRAEWQGRELLLDGAHNPPAAAALRQELDRLDGSRPAPRRWLLAIQRHKEGAAMLRQLLRPGDEAGVLALPGHACWSAEDLEQAGPWPDIRLLPLPELRQGLDWLSASTALPVVAGSLYLLGQVLPLLERQAPTADG
jgi:dihydrofolate synthase/folylpolyglutamate synthase